MVTLVGLCLERSASLVVGGVWPSSGPAAPTWPSTRSYPDERIRWMLEDSGAAAVVVRRGTRRGSATTVERPWSWSTAAAGRDRSGSGRRADGAAAGAGRDRPIWPTSSTPRDRPADPRA